MSVGLTGATKFPASIYENAPDLIDWLAAETGAYTVKPEIEAFDPSHILLAKIMAGQGQNHRHVLCPIWDRPRQLIRVLAQCANRRCYNQLSASASVNAA